MLRKIIAHSFMTLVALSNSLTPAAANDLNVLAAKAKIEASLDHNYAGLDLLYRDIHAHPEIAFQEIRTSALLASEMRKLGFTVTEHVGKTGLVAIYSNGPGPTVMIRTELDALPMEEKTGLPYASRAQQMLEDKPTFTDHSCGHDVHMSWWIGTAQALLAMKDQWSGTLMFIAQPAEETVSGAKAMIADGLFSRFPKPDYAFAAHVMPDAAGTVRIKDKTAMSSADAVEIIFKGRGGHGSQPSATIDPIVMGAHFVTDVQTIISREKDAGTFGVVTVGSFQAGTVPNIIPDQARLLLTLRSYSPEVRKLELDGVTRTARAVAMMANAPDPQINFPNGTAALVNDSALAARSNTVLRAAFGDRVTFIPSTGKPESGSEDFSEYVTAGVPSVFFLIGGTDPKLISDYKARGAPIPINHSPFFAPLPELSIRTGVMTLSLATLMVAGK